MADQEQPPQGPPAPPPGGQLPLPGAGGDGGNKNIVPTNIEDEMKRSYLDYSMSVIVGRALPDVRDGLKPVHRRILYGMHEMGLHYNRSTRKCARIVGDVSEHYRSLGVSLDPAIAAARLMAMVDSGLVESAGDLRKWRFSEVRLKG